MTSEQIRDIVPEIKTFNELLYLLNAIKNDIYGEKYHAFTLQQLHYYCSPSRSANAYKHFKIPKKSGGYREISAPTKSLKSMLRCLNVIFQALYEPSKIAKGFLRGKSIMDNASIHVGMNYVFNTDLKDFFPSITQARVWAVLQLKPLNFTKEAASIIAGLCCMRVNDESSTGYKNILPQGSPASPILTNIICQKLDRRLYGLAKRFDLKCSRYADDITFSSSHNIYFKGSPFLRELTKIIKEQNFKLNVGKTRLQTKSMRREVTGLVVSDKINVPRKYSRSIGSVLYIWERYGFDEAYLKFFEHYKKNNPSKKISGPEFFLKVIEGRILFMKMVKGENDPVYRRYLNKFESLKARILSNKTHTYLVYSITRFEEEFHTRVDFKFRTGSPHTEDNMMGVTRFHDQNIFVIITKKCRSAIFNILTGTSTTPLSQIKSNFFIVGQKSVKSILWFVMNSNPRYLSELLNKNNDENIGQQILSTLKFSGDVQPETQIYQNCSLDEILSILVNNNFSDLSILSQWDKTRRI